MTSRRVIDVHGVAVVPGARAARETQRESGPDAAAYRAALARRRKAAHRCEPLPGMPADGSLATVDPLAEFPAEVETAPVVLADILVLEIEGHTAWAMGVPNFRVRSLLDRLEVPRQFDVSRRVWTCPAKRAHDVARGARARGLEAVVVAEGAVP